MAKIIHITDLHLDHCPGNLDSMLELVRDVPVDIYLIGGDNGNDEGVLSTIEALRELQPHASIAWVMGNHDLWYKPYTHLWNDFRELPATYLELGNLETEYCTIVGTYGHYDYSGGTLKLSFEQYENFTDGHCIWNDRFIERTGKSNPQIAKEIADRFCLRYDLAIERGLPILVLMHTWPFAPTDDRYRSFASAYCCNQMIGDILVSHQVLPQVLFCGHTHQAAQWDEFGFPMINTGSDYNHVRITQWEIPHPTTNGDSRNQSAKSSVKAMRRKTKNRSWRPW
jgi:predicted phosphodiesterase